MVDAAHDKRATTLFETLKVRMDGGVLFVHITAPPMNLLGPALVRDLVSLIAQAEADDSIKVLVFKSADPDYFIAHVDVTRIAEYRQEAAKLVGEASIGLLFRHLSASRLVTIAQVEGRVRAAGNEFVLACDMRFAARETAIFAQPEPGFGVVPGAGGIQHLTRLVGRGRALEVMLSAQDYDADLAERYGWINRALPAAALDDFVSSLAHRIARFPTSGLAVAKERVNAIALAPVEEFRLRSFWRGGAKTRRPKPLPGCVQARLPNPGRRIGSRPPRGRTVRRLIEGKTRVMVKSTVFRFPPRRQGAFGVSSP
jgi:enoyl-CoA hydratase/carnithine racemase